MHYALSIKNYALSIMHYELENAAVRQNPAL